MTIAAPTWMRCSPRFHTRRRPERDSFGGELARIAGWLGQPFMPWQLDAAMVGCEIDRETGGPAYREVIVTVPRQHGKTTLYLTWQLNRCISPRWSQPQRSAFTAQSGKDARDKWLDELFPLIRRSRKLTPFIAQSRGRLAINEGMGNESVRFRNGSLIRLLSTSTSSGHSKTLHQAVLDEIWHDQDARREQGLRPAMLTVQDAQILTCSTAGNEMSVVLDRKVRQGRAAAEADTGRGTCYIEYSAPDGWDPDDDESFSGFMPALCPDPPCRCGGGRWRHTVTMDVIRSERDSLEAPEFARAYGNIPNRSLAAELADLGAWLNRVDPLSQPAGRVALGFEIRPDQSSAAIALAGQRGDSLGHGEIIAYGAGAGWLVPRLYELAERWDPCVTVLNPSGQSGTVLRELEDRGFAAVRPGKEPPPGKRPLLVLSAREYAQACGGLVRDVREDAWRHRGQEELNRAARAAKTRVLEDAYAWSYRNSPPDVDICPLAAMTVARYGFQAFGVAAGQFFGAWR